MVPSPSGRIQPTHSDAMLPDTTHSDGTSSTSRLTPVDQGVLRPYHHHDDDAAARSPRQRPAWHLRWALQRHRYLKRFYRPVKWLNSLIGKGHYVTLGEVLFWGIYAAIVLAIAGVSGAQFATSRNDTTNTTSTASTVHSTSRGGSNRTSHGQDGGTTNDAASQFGTFGTLLMTLALLPVGRNSFLVFVFNLPFERAVKYHRWLAYVAIIFLAAHGACYIDFYGNATQFPGGIGSQLWDGVTGVNLSGFISVCSGVALAITSLPFIRRHAFELFYRTHIPLFISFVAFAAIHEGGAVAILIPALLLYALDLVLRVRSVRKPSPMRSFKVLPDGVIRIEFEKTGFTYDAGQYVFINIPAVSRLEWHPFSISTTPLDPLISIHIRVLGTWTAEVAKLAIATSAEGPLPVLYVDGPYGEMTMPLEDHKNFLLISGGIGITPLQSIFNTLVADWRAGRRELRHCAFVWSVREGASYTYLLDEATQKAHKIESNLGVLPPFHSPLLLELYDDSRRKESDHATNEKPIITTEFYLTGSRTQDMELLKMDSGSPMWVQKGRPDLDALFQRVARDNGGVPTCAVMVCGPQPLVEAVRTACIRHSGGSSGTAFVLHEETFEF
ncbi:FAD-binding domain-containing protein [Blyttiomyces helicus]|uniref:FAD-binding domain-containing protein n=1 Tax=Blyttiomyces helicus TaxID=388810 RepID=A0A4P9WK57_9FUNG|nr:FAD-binding domain-containing protein [Blyttiomyces helicus]|eukprot:RKO91938.1 FAD-binding domain-containing protein [Blyttiomyces helicus]